MRTGFHRAGAGLFRRHRNRWLGWAAAAAVWTWLLPGAAGLHARAIDYLSAEEIEKVRDSQKPHQRMSVLNDIFKRR
ncbi:MAG: hypothetical protein OXG96_03725, partial [Acidobacteria bacterium]|nr:hypothetical protein [Acidobacteriota bacterium]